MYSGSPESRDDGGGSSQWIVVRKKRRGQDHMASSASFRGFFLNPRTSEKLGTILSRDVTGLGFSKMIHNF